MLEITPGYFAYQLPKWAENGNTFSGPYYFGPCEVAGNQDYNLEPYDVEVKCDPAGEASEELSENGAEVEVERLIHVLNNEQPSYVITLGEFETFCEIFIEPDGSIRRNQEFKENCNEQDLRVEIE